MRRLFIHLGYPKTGTTSLQQTVFDPLFQEGRLGYLGMFGFSRDATPERKEFFDALTLALYLNDEVEFDAQLPQLRQQFNALVNGFDPALPLLLSNEHFTLSQHSTKQRNAQIRIEKTARRLARLFIHENVDLLVALRRQDNLAWSLFLENRSRRHHANSDKYLVLETYLDDVINKEHINANMFAFEKVLATYRAAFPHGTIKVWLFEDFCNDGTAVVRDILSFIGLNPDDALLERLSVANRNSRTMGNDAVLVSNRDGLLSRIASLLHRSGITPIASGSFAVHLIKRLIPKDKVSPPDNAQKEALLYAFVDSNHTLEQLYPSLRNGLKNHGYLPKAKNIDASFSKAVPEKAV